MAVTALIKELGDLLEQVEVLKAENAVLRNMADVQLRNMRGVDTELHIFGRTLPQLSKDLARLQCYDAVATNMKTKGT